MREVDLSFVPFQPDFALLEQLLHSLSEPSREPVRRNLLIHDNSPDAEAPARVAALPALHPGSAFARVDIRRSDANVGFGRGHNASFARATAPFFLVLNQDCVLEPGALEALMEAASRDDANVAAWEMRQIPLEHPKAYDPATLAVEWVSGAASLC